MNRLTLFVTALALMMIISGCSTFKAMDGSTETEIEAFEEGIPAVARATEFKPVQIPPMEPKPITGLVVIEAEPEAVAEVIEAEPEAVEEVEPESLIGVEVTEVSAPLSIEECPGVEGAGRPLSDIKIKVLNGNGISGSAKRMKGKLEKMGYVIERIDNAPRFTFKVNTVYYADCFKAEALDLTRKIGGHTITKPLIWYSIFDIIVTTGKK